MGTGRRELGATWAAAGLWPSLVVALGLPALLAWEAPLVDSSEPRYAEAAVTMLRTGDYLLPVYNGEPRLAKPPLLYWAQAASVRVLGPTELAVRLPSLLATLATAIVVARVGRRVIGTGGGVLAAVVYASSPMTIVLGAAASPDALFVLWTTCALALTLPDGEPTTARTWMLAGAVALGLLTKGPVMLLALVPSFLRHDGVRVAGSRSVFAVSLIAVLPLVAWGAALAVRLGPEPLLDVLRHDVLRRATVGVDHPRPVWFFVPVLLAGAFPWVFWVPAAARRAWWRPHPHTQAGALATWGAAWILVMSLVPTKLPGYVAPALPALAVLVASTWCGAAVLGPRAVRRRAAVVTSVGLAASAGAPVVAGPPLHGAIVAGGLVLAAVTVWAGRRCRRRPPARLVAALASAWVLAELFVVVRAAPAVTESASRRRLLQSGAARVRGRDRLLCPGHCPPSAVWYGGTRLREAPLASARTAAEGRCDELWIVRERELFSASAEARGRLRWVAGDAGYWLACSAAVPDLEQPDAPSTPPSAPAQPSDQSL